MVKKIIYTAFLILACCFAKAQDNTLYGRVFDAEENAVEGAAVVLSFDGKNFGTITDNSGRYEIKIPKNQNVFVKISHVAFKDISVLIVSKKQDIERNFHLTENTVDLDAVEIKSDKTRYTQKKDTTTFYANAIKINRDATAYELITKKLPSVSVKNGKIQVQGEQVEHILLNGQEYFSGDVKLALQNIPASIIDKIQIFDKKSDYGIKTEFETGKTSKAVNLITKKENRNSFFGKVYSGAGTDEKFSNYAAAGMIKNNSSLAVFFQNNNINLQNFLSSDLISSTSDIQQNTPGKSPYSKKGGTDFSPQSADNFSSVLTENSQNGISETTAAGMNLNTKTQNEKLKTTIGYLFADIENQTEYKISDDYFQDGNVNAKKTQNIDSKDINNRFNLKTEFSDSVNYLSAAFSGIFQNRKSDISTDFLRTGFDEEFLTQNTVQNAFSNSGEITAVHKFRNAQTIVLNFKISFGKTDEDFSLYKGQDFSQFTKSQNKFSRISPLISYVLPIANRHSIKIETGFQNNSFEITTDTPDGDEMLSGKTSQDYGGMFYNVGYAFKGVNFENVTGMFLQFDNVLLPYSHFKFYLNSLKIHLLYNTEYKYPAITKLHRTVINTDPEFLVHGNGNLTPQYVNSFVFRLVKTGISGNGIFVAFADYKIISDYISDCYRFENKSQIMTFTNFDGYKKLNTLAALGFPCNFLKSNLNFSLETEYEKYPSFFEDKNIMCSFLSLGGDLTVAGNLSEDIDFVIDTKLEKIQNKNIQDNSVDYYALSYGGQICLYVVKKRLKFMYECGQTTNYGLKTKDFNSLVSNFSISYNFLKNRQLELKLSANDIFEGNVCFDYEINSVFRRETTSNTLGRYFMITLNFNFNTAKK